MPNKSVALILAFLLTALLIFNYAAFSQVSASSNKENVIIGRVIDGDTLVLKDGRTVRLSNINSPEKGMPGYDLALTFLSELANKTIQLESFGEDKYRRTLGKLYTPSYLNLEIVKQGLANRFLVDDSENSEFRKAEEFAIENSLGIWKKSEFYDCIKSTIFEQEEYIILENNCNSINIVGWTIKDESRKIYKFNSFQLNKLNKVKIHSEKGDDNSTDLFWGSSTNIWNNDKDTAYLFDSQAEIVHFHSYGY